MQTVRFITRDKNLFFNTLKSRVDAHFRERGISSHANYKMVIKTIVLMTFYIVPFAIFAIFVPPFWVSILLWIVMGAALAGIGMSVMHDANHGAYSANNTVNQLVAYSLNMLGASIHNWKLQHNVLHHTYTNIAHLDHDIDEKGFFRFTPHNRPKFMHRFQFIYAFAFYGIMSLYWVTIKDFVQFFRYIHLGVNRKSRSENVVIFLKIVALKVVYFGVFLGIPVLLGNTFVVVLTGFILMQFIAGIILTTIFQMAHTVEGTSHPLPCTAGNIENDWAIHQLNTTSNFARHNKWLSWYVGGLNFQVEHHLFSKICHVHYPEIAPIVKQTADEFGVPYLEQRTFWQALNSHITVLRQFGRMPSLDDAIG